MSFLPCTALTSPLLRAALAETEEGTPFTVLIASDAFDIGDLVRARPRPTFHLISNDTFSWCTIMAWPKQDPLIAPVVDKIRFLSPLLIVLPLHDVACEGCHSSGILPGIVFPPGRRNQTTGRTPVTPLPRPARGMQALP
jgi:hypothetical protein